MRRGQKRMEVEETIDVPEMDEFQEFYEPKQTQIDRAIIKLFTKSINAMKIIRLLHGTSTDLYKKQIDVATKIGKSNSRNLLRRLTAAGIIEKFIPTPVDMKKVFYRIPNKDLTAKMINHYYRICSFQLANAIPFDVMSLEELAKNKQLYDLSQKYALTFEEVIKALELNKMRVETIYSEHGEGKLIGFRRKPMPVESWAIPEEQEEEQEEGTIEEIS